MQSINQKIEVKITPPNNTINSFDRTTLQLLESNSLQDYLNQKAYQPTQKETNYYHHLTCIQ